MATYATSDFPATDLASLEPGDTRWFYHDLNDPYSLYRNIVSLDHATQTPSSTTTSTSARARPRTRTTRGSPSRRATPPSSASWPSSSPSTSSGGRRPPCQRCSCYGRSSRSEIQGRDSIGLKLTGVHFRAHFRCKIHLGAN